MRTRPQNHASQVNLDDVWDFATNKLATTTWQAHMQNVSKSSVLEATKINDPAVDAHQQIWQDNDSFLQHVLMCGMSQNEETSVATHGQFSDVIRDAIADVDNVHIQIQLCEPFVCQHVSPPSVPAATMLPTMPSTPLPNNITCSGAQPQNHLDINATLNEAA